MELNLKPGDKVKFWLTVLGKRVQREGIFKGLKSFNGLAVVQTGQGLDTFTHYIKPNKLTKVNSNEIESRES